MQGGWPKERRVRTGRTTKCWRSTRFWWFDCGAAAVEVGKKGRGKKKRKMKNRERMRGAIGLYLHPASADGSYIHGCLSFVSVLWLQNQGMAVQADQAHPLWRKGRGSGSGSKRYAKHKVQLVAGGFGRARFALWDQAKRSSVQHPLKGYVKRSAKTSWPHTLGRRNITTVGVTCSTMAHGAAAGVRGKGTVCWPQHTTAASRGKDSNNVFDFTIIYVESTER